MKQAILGGVSALALLAGPAFAADIPVKAPPRAAAVADQWYISAFGGVAWSESYKFSFINDTTGAAFRYQVSLDDGYTFGGAFGREINRNVRLEIEVAHTRFKFGDDYASTSFTGLNETGSLRVTTVMGNAWFNLWDSKTGWVTPYAGGGVGVGFVKGDLTVSNGSGRQFDGNKTGAAFQAGAGLRFPVMGNLDIDLGWRFHHVIDVPIPSVITGFHTDAANLSWHTFQGGLTLKF